MTNELIPVDVIHQFMIDMGLDIQQLKVTSMAANMGNEFFRQIAAFTDRLNTLKPV